MASPTKFTDLEIENDFTVGGDQDMTGDVAVGGTLEVTGNVTVGGTLEVTGATTLTGTTTASTVNATNTVAATTLTAANIDVIEQTLTASGAITAGRSFVELDTADGKIEATLAAPTKGQLLVITQADAGTDGHTVTLTAGTYDGTNTVATFNAAGETLVLFGVSATRFVIIENIGSVALS